MKIRARCIVEGEARAEVLYSSKPIAFLQGVDPEKGIVSDPKHEIYGKEFSGKILAFPNSVGSSVGAYVIYRMKKNRKAPKAIINQRADIITASGCAIAGIPLYDVTEGDIRELKGKRIAISSRSSEIQSL